MDYKKFLGKTDELVLPSFGGVTVSAKGRTLRLEEPLEAGWWRFVVKGRQATPQGRADEEAPDLGGLSVVRGHLVSGVRLVTDEGIVHDVQFPPPDEPELFAPCTARRWHSGELLFDGIEFEEEAEEAARRALEDGETLEAVKGVPASLRAAFAYALVESASAHLQIPVVPLEVRHQILALAHGGRERAEATLRALADRRQEAERARTARANAPADAAAAARVANVLAGWSDRTTRVHEALRSAGAQLLRMRGLSNDQSEVTYRFMGSRFLAVVHAQTLNVIDAGVCLDGADSALTLDSLPGVIREAIDTGQLVVTRRVLNDG
jgi:hypothetical protein